MKNFFLLSTFQKPPLVFTIFACLLLAFPQYVQATGSSNLRIEILALCGNSIKESGEQCDDTDFGVANCASQGYDTGSLGCNENCTFDISECTLTESSGGEGGGGGGGGGGTETPITSVIFVGRAYPLSKVSVLKDGQLAISTIAGPDSNFSISFSGLSAGNYSFSVYGEDTSGRRSSLFTFPVFITLGSTTQVSGIFIAPTIAIDKSEVKQGDNIAIFGQSTPHGQITISVHSDPEFFKQTTADSNGIYLYNFDTSVLNKGQHATKAKASLGASISSFGQEIEFVVSDKTVLSQPEQTVKTGDLNGDGHVNLIDFSILAYWYKRPISESFAKFERDHFNGDGKIDLIDLSIMAFHWTG
ncbi:MAG: hypothetical protein COX82_04845 [Candidatus Magasanikbacteria bacterium CG_4_10_14_0_2_um_filter_41_10]|uniref:Dockerin domain-containing protein n=1 Tax=Candidatus Magasanikbacteria bacterium CG_4_10_14_0_2_um_filter_41_10 TaxID=1974638 RepID=A0A2M7V211_9BACT|nr:MAG: hypothetical protein COX82_04845 [Candidatus Magasanikbacteria bacterium CG_4_10_14_0_2_um_filter_41_10]